MAALLRLARIDSSLLISLAVFVPVYSRTGDLGLGLIRSLPLLLVAISTYVANDLDDVERDRINHPERPLPSGVVSSAIAVVLHLVFLGAALASIKLFVESPVDFWYYLTVAAAVSYGRIAEWLSFLKPFYASALIAMPILIARAWFPNEPRLTALALVLFLLSVGRELCMDITDRRGDKPSALHRIEEAPLAAAAFAIQFVALGFLAPHVRGPLDLGCLALMVLLSAASCRWWFRRGRRPSAIWLMKATLVPGMVFLLR